MDTDTTIYGNKTLNISTSFNCVSGNTAPTLAAIGMWDATLCFWHIQGELLNEKGDIKACVLSLKCSLIAAPLPKIGGWGRLIAANQLQEAYEYAQKRWGGQWKNFSCLWASMCLQKLKIHNSSEESWVYERYHFTWCTHIFILFHCYLWSNMCCRFLKQQKNLQNLFISGMSVRTPSYPSFKLSLKKQFSIQRSIQNAQKPLKWDLGSF